jgi:acetyl esterase/lipase
MSLATTVTILLLHGGGFSGGDPSSVAPLVDDLRAVGYDAIAVDYRKENPTGNILGEIATVRRKVEAVEGRGPVVLYGVSAGGTLAAALAARGEVAGAVVAGAPTNLLTWFGLSPMPTPAFWQRLGMDGNARREASPIFRLDGDQSPQLLLYGDIDLVVPVEQGRSYLRAAQGDQPDTTFRLMSVSPHAYWPPYRTIAREWIQARWPASSGSVTRGSSPLTRSTHHDEALVQTRVLPQLRMKRHREKRSLLRSHRMTVH